MDQANGTNVDSVDLALDPVSICIGGFVKNYNIAQHDRNPTDPVIANWVAFVSVT